jgi:hypothetical protein
MMTTRFSLMACAPIQLGSSASGIASASLGLLALTLLTGVTAPAAAQQPQRASPARAKSVLTAAGRNGSHSFKVTLTQTTTGAYHALSTNFSYETEFDITEDASGVYRITGGTKSLTGGKGHVTNLTLKQDRPGSYLLQGTNSTYMTDVRVSSDSSGSYSVKGQNLSYLSDLKISGSRSFHVEGKNGTYPSDITTTETGPQHVGPELKEPLPLQVLLALSVIVGAKPSGGGL